MMMQDGGDEKLAEFEEIKEIPPAEAPEEKPPSVCPSAVDSEEPTPIEESVQETQVQQTKTCSKLASQYVVDLMESLEKEITDVQKFETGESRYVEEECSNDYVPADQTALVPQESNEKIVIQKQFSSGDPDRIDIENNDPDTSVSMVQSTARGLIEYEPKKKPKRIVLVKASSSRRVIDACKKLLDELEQKRHLNIEQRHLEATLKRQLKKYSTKFEGVANKGQQPTVANVDACQPPSVYSTPKASTRQPPSVYSTPKASTRQVDQPQKPEVRKPEVPKQKIRKPPKFPQITPQTPQPHSSS